MAHIAKYQSGAIGHMCALYENEARERLAELVCSAEKLPSVKAS